MSGRLEVSNWIIVIPVQAPLVGAVGQEYVHTVLTSMNPQNAVKEIQKHGAFRNKRCKPVLELLDQLGLKRCPSKEHCSREELCTAGRPTYRRSNNDAGT